jgi:hypothetical protein
MKMLISMSEFQPIFGWLSALGGLLLGLLLGAAFACCFGSLKFRSVPMHLLNQAVVNMMWIALPIIISFIVFRGTFGKYPFDPGVSLWHFIDELVLIRLQYFFGGALFALVSSLTVFLAAVAQAVLDPESVVEQHHRSEAPSRYPVS